MGSQSRHSAGRFAAAAALTLVGSAAALAGWSGLAVNRRMPLPPALPGRHERLRTRRAGDISLYGSTEVEGVPLLLIHSINAAANAYEVRPLYLRYRGTRPVYALDLPGFGFSERSRRRYTPRLMVEAIHAAVDEIRHRHGGWAIDALAVSLSASYLARASLERSDAYRSLALISPTGFDGRLSGDGPPDGHRGRDWLRDALDRPPLGRPLFDALVTRPSMRFFLQKTFGSSDIDEGLLAYDYASAHQPGAEHAPWCFIAGHLFPTDATRLYERLRLPVWMVHGTRGDFVDYRLAPRVADRPNWRVETLPTGAFPHFEQPAAVAAGYDAFLTSIIRLPAARPA
ncbi:alpha/beta hydrolase [Methylobacterium phyllosphaerae]|uniref:Alpha/beta hydrolase n=1 Tax=Methylobacterium phyllosphaerae TaxID=418223 RepID=A0AAE8HTR5_9HYPH|nr:alpha/beta hydrolase [Methylobacterium phyllosphaerae]APT31614.1 alpha/beta hydrolase [Methylobacterium phyllosphaerae]SFH16710.1 Pimeloyl-ACP methyl ester carboxylesterase [Methylobacterium phyllosphaerae]